MSPRSSWVTFFLLGASLLQVHVHAARLDPAEFSQMEVDRPSSLKPPKWAAAYEIEFVVTMPSDFLMQPQGFTIPLKAWYDGPNQQARVESFGGVDTVLILKDNEYDVHPRIDKLKCWKYPGNGHVDPILPDINAWKPVGSVVLDGREAHIWKLEFRQGEQVSTYSFYTAVADGAPLKLHMFGENIMEGSHFDEYLYEFKSYSPLSAESSSNAFEPPELCKVGQAEEGGSQRHWLSRQVSMLLPSSRTRAQDASAAVGAAHAAWSLLHPSAPAADEAQHQLRLQRFQHSVARVTAHNAQPDKTYTMQLGRFADWSEEEYLSVMMPDAWRRKQGLPSARQARRQQALAKQPHASDPIGKFKRRLRSSDLPRRVDWRGKGVDPGVKDQGYCGSCWAFAATGAMEGAWFLATGQRQSFSEQQLVDCAFDWGVDACDGGDAEPAINFIAHSGGIAIEQDYYYEGIVDYCRASNFTEGLGQFEGFLEVESRDELALMEAVYTMGPLAVAVDASPDSFGYYKEGIYKEPKCSNYDLDHAVLLYGWGTENGIDYWLIKNSWSKLYGNDGFIKIARGSNDCGISTQGSIAVVAKQHRQQQAAANGRLGAAQD